MLQSITKYGLFALAAGIVGLGASSAQAGTVSFAKPAGSSTAYSYNFTGDDGVGFTATATTDTDPEKLHWDNSGLGVKSGWLDVNQIDMLGDDEILYLTFDKPVVLDWITFSHVGCNFLTGGKDEYILLINGTNVAEGSIPGATILDNGVGTVYYDDFGAITQIGLTVPDLNDGYKVKAMGYHAVPLPPAAWAALGTMGLIALPRAVRKLRELA
ncbi:MAG: hypothetical protein ACREIT_01985 [Tepidisphaeraceae bacterium]